MKIYVPGFPVQHVDEPAEASTAQAPSANPLPSVAEAMRLANQRQTQVLGYTRERPGQTPLQQNLRTDGPTLEQWVNAGYPADKYPPEGYAELDSPALALRKATLSGQNPSLGAGIDALTSNTAPHSVNDHPVVS